MTAVWLNVILWLVIFANGTLVVLNYRLRKRMKRQLEDMKAGIEELERTTAMVRHINEALQIKAASGRSTLWSISRPN